MIMIIRMLLTIIVSDALLREVTGGGMPSLPTNTITAKIR